MIFKKRAKKNYAFTLAEVLITLGIIGVVAALTIPTLMNNYQILQFKTAAKSAFAKSAQAFTQMKVDGTYTPGQSDYSTAQNDFKNNFMTKFKILKNCGDADECVHADMTNYIYKTLNGDNVAHMSHWGSGQFITVDGTFYAIDDNQDFVLITVDVNGYEKPPNQFGVDAYMFNIDNNGNFIPEGATNSLYNSGHCARAVWSSGWGCMSNVLRGIDY